MRSSIIQMKRALRTALFILLLNVVGMGKCIAQAPWVDAIVVDGIVYDLYADGTAVLTSYMPPATGTINIHSTVTYTNNEGITRTFTVTEIWYQAFKNCSGLTGSLVIPNTVTKIDTEAFSGCTGFTGNLVIPNSVVEIGDYAFFNCNGFRGSLTIGEGVTEIGMGAFSLCSGFTTVYYNAVFANPSIVGGYEIGGEEFYFPFWKCGGSLVIGGNVKGGLYFEGASFTGPLYIPNSVIEIGEGAFASVFNFATMEYYPSGFTGDLIIPNSVTKIGDGAFCGCNGLTGDLIIPNSVTEIGSGAFDGCTGLDGDLLIPNSVTKIENGAFKGCTKLKKLNISMVVFDIDDEEDQLGYEIFSGCNFNRIHIDMPIIPSIFIGKASLQSCTSTLSFGNSVTEIGWGAFYNCSGFTGSLTLPNSVTTIGSYVFYNCSGFTGSLTLPNSVTSIGSSAFYNCSGFTGTLTLPSTLTTIGSFAFANCSGFKGVLTLSNSIDHISEATFYGCSGFVGDLVIPNSVRLIGGGAFYGCSGFTNLTISNSVNYIFSNAFHGCSGFAGDLTVPNSVTWIGGGAFSSCSNIKKVHFNPSSCSNNYYINDPLYQYLQINGEVDETYYVDWTELPPFAGCSGALVVGENMHDIPAYLFKNADFNKISLYQMVNSIGDEAFAGCDSLKTIVCWNDTPPTFLGEHVFEGVDKDHVVVKVPCGKALTYMNTDGWEDFNHYEMFISTWHLIVTSNEPAHCETEIVQLPLCLSGEAIVRARPASGYQFLGWYEDNERVSQDTLYTFYHNSPRVLEARVRIGTGMEDFTAVEANVYPNPTTGRVRIEAEELRRITISNMLGQVIYEGKANGNEFQYDFGKHGSGLYLIHIETANGTAVKKVSVR